jgi:Holliday junction resolvasome RuvABC ATP-dependent DNA helicase subunit
MFPFARLPLTESKADAWLTNPVKIGSSSEISRVIIEPKQINIDGINESTIEYKNFEFRPQNWDQFIGQDAAKERAQIIIKQYKRRMKSHCILTGLKGHGKTSYIELLAKELNAKLIQRIGRQLDENTIIDVINEINISDNPNIMLFIDEIETLDRKLFKIFNPIIESFQLGGKHIRPFLFACATVDKARLLKNNPDTIDRINHHISFCRYSLDDLFIIIKQYQENLYPQEIISTNNIKIISENCKYNPRTAINMLEFLIVEPDIKKLLKNYRIVKDGLTDIDIKILSILSQYSRPMGSNAISTLCGLPEQEYMREYEEYLVEFEYLQRAPSRCITNKGKNFLKNL